MTDPRQELAAIRRLMEESQETIGEDGRHFVLWGLITAAGLLGTWAAVTGRLDVDVRWMWAALVALGWIGSFWIGFRSGRRERVRTLGRRLIGVVWIGCGVTLSLVAAAALFGPVSTRALSGLVSVIVAGAFLSSAVLTGHRWLAAVAAAWWFLGGLMLFFPGLYTLPLLAAMAIALEAIPGLVLYQRARRREVPQAA